MALSVQFCHLHWSHALISFREWQLASLRLLLLAARPELGPCWHCADGWQDPDDPRNTKDEQGNMQLVLLDDVSGAFRPGVLTCLMGASGDHPGLLPDCRHHFDDTSACRALYDACLISAPKAGWNWEAGLLSGRSPS